ncbi:unnamed protein product [Caenorhabditis bovis]|uniref:SH3 domain-containing protein n=1 Tax=Caenorhabditis bovis TaxID=2654633 RepID=A0A8S1EJD3_9PELO|nr:unnamed protein product [Caenorhabditis bovis]
MSADNAAEAVLTPAMAAEIPPKVYNQLSQEFLPASKQIAMSGMVLLKAYREFQEALTIYCDATHKLVKSADTANAKARHEAIELATVFKEFVKCVNAHRPIVAEFETLALKVNDYSSREKNKLKSDFQVYKKEEKKVLKDKHGKNSSEAKQFYQKEAAEWSRQQELRYKFFNDKLRSWIFKYEELFKNANISGRMNSIENVHNVEATAQVVEINWHDEIHKAVENEQTAKPVEKVEVNQQQQQEVHHEHPIEHQHHEENPRSKSNSSVATSLEELPENQNIANDRNSSVLFISKQNYGSAEYIKPASEVNIPVPQVRSSTQQYNLQHQYEAPSRRNTTHSAASYLSQNRSQPPNLYSQVAVHPKKEIYKEQPHTGAPGYTKPASMLPGAVPVFSIPNDIHKTSSPEAQVFYTPPINVRNSQIHVHPSIERPISERDMDAKRYHVESNYVANVSPAHRPPQRNPSTRSKAEVLVPSAFTSAQYGSILIVNEDFNATSGEQMTVNRGDKVVLLKSGTRGWVFVRDTVSNQTGWIPEPYVNA